MSFVLYLRDFEPDRVLLRTGRQYEYVLSAG